jgi:uncharacterized RDD family membrane protein YckC
MPARKRARARIAALEDSPVYCSRCGIQVPEGAQYCPGCGQPADLAAANASAITLPPASAATPSIPIGGIAATYIPTTKVGYAGFWLRFVAIIIDGLIIEVVLGIPFFMFLGGTSMLRGMMSGNPPEDYLGQFFAVIALFSLAGLVARWLYFALLESSPWQATLGKRALGLYVTDLAGQRVSFGRASGRFFGKIISSLTLMIGYIMAGFTERKQALHDMIAGTLVLRKL